MTAANAVTLVMVMVSYFLYSSLMSAAQFGIYAGALAIAKFGAMLLDGGLKVALVKSKVNVEQGVNRALFIGSATLSVALTLLLLLFLSVLVEIKIIEFGTAQLYIVYGAAYLITYPILFIPLAQLERRQRYLPVASAESFGISVEYALPALLWLYISPGFWSFMLAAWLGRSLRAIILLIISDDRQWLIGRAKPKWSESRSLLLEGLGLQAAMLVSMLRDSIHLLVVGPWFGKEWAGLYAWALQLCSVASQVFVQTASRVALPALRLAQGAGERWNVILKMISWLTIFTAPPLVFLTDIAVIVNEHIFDNKWTSALALLPFIIMRMIPGLATTPLGSMVLAEKGSRAFLSANALWTGGEIVAALLLMWLYGPIGLAWSYAFMAWFGIAAFLYQLPERFGLFDLISRIFMRPSLWAACILVAVFHSVSSRFDISLGFMQKLVLIALLINFCYIIERSTRIMLASIFLRGKSA